MNNLRLFALLAVLVLAGCGDSGKTLPEQARDHVGEAAGVKLHEQPAPVKEVEAAFSASDHGQLIQLYVLRSADDVATMRAAVPDVAADTRVRVITHGRVFVTYTALGKDNRGDKVADAVDGLDG